MEKSKKQVERELIAEKEREIIDQMRGTGYFQRKARKSLRDEGKLARQRNYRKEPVEFKANNPIEAVKKVDEPKPEVPKVEKTANKRDVTALTKISKLAHEIREKDETWNAAIKRASVIYKEEKAKALEQKGDLGKK
jgi:hypothetical protein